MNMNLAFEIQCAFNMLNSTFHALQCKLLTTHHIKKMIHSVPFALPKPWTRSEQCAGTNFTYITLSWRGKKTRLYPHFVDKRFPPPLIYNNIIKF